MKREINSKMASNSEKIGEIKKAEPEYDQDWLRGTSAENKMNKKATEFSNPVYKKLSKINGRINSMSMNELTKTLNELDLETCGKKEALQKRLKSHYKEINLKSMNMKSELKCRFDYVCVIDYEATCTGVQQKDYPHEIIEFPIVLVNMKTLTIEDCFKLYCKPIINPKLSKFCIELTGITQEQVENADEFPIVLEKVKNWFDQHQLGTVHKYAIATDGPWDMQNFLNLQCHLSQIAYPRWARKWIDVRKLFANYLGVRRCNIASMLGYYGFEFEGQQHCGLDDAKNIARIMIRLAKDGCDIRINANLKKCLGEIEQKETSSSQLKGASSDDIDDTGDDLDFQEEG